VAKIIIRDGRRSMAWIMSWLMRVQWSSVRRVWSTIRRGVGTSTVRKEGRIEYDQRKGKGREGSSVDNKIDQNGS
jgi:hypothetical protein